METLKRREQRLREVVLEQHSDLVLSAAREYRQSFDEEWSALSEAERRQSELPLQAVQLMQWAISVLTKSRAELAGRRRAFFMAGHYIENRHDRRTRTWGTAG